MTAEDESLKRDRERLLIECNELNKDNFRLKKRHSRLARVHHKRKQESKRLRAHLKAAEEDRDNMRCCGNCENMEVVDCVTRGRRIDLRGEKSYGRIKYQAPCCAEIEDIVTGDYYCEHWTPRKAKS